MTRDFRLANLTPTQRRAWCFVLSRVWSHSERLELPRVRRAFRPLTGVVLGLLACAVAFAVGGMWR